MSTPLNENRPQPRIRCAQEDFYGVSEAVIDSLEEHLPKFEAYSSRYSATTVTNLRTELLVARALPAEGARTARHAMLRMGLDEKRASGIRLMLQLETLIREAFGAEMLEQQKHVAGFDLYDDAYHSEWNSMEGMLIQANTYVTDNAAVLTADGGMPVGFAAALNGAKTDFSAQLRQFVEEEEIARRGTDAKIEANNALYDKIITLCSDGRRIFWDSAAIREEFTYETVLGLVRSVVSTHRVNGFVVRTADGSAVIDAKVLMEELRPDGSYAPGVEVRTDLNGEFRYASVRNGRFRLSAGADGLETVRKGIEVDGGPLTVDFSLGAVV